MSIVTAVVLSTLLLTVTGCASSSPPSDREAGDGQERPHKKPIKRDQERSMNEESMEAVR